MEGSAKFSQWMAIQAKIVKKIREKSVIYSKIEKNLKRAHEF